MRRRFHYQPAEGRYLFPSDAYVRRQLHEFGASGFEFYDQVLERMDYQPTDIALDIGAGIGLDGLDIASTYGPRMAYLLEPLEDRAPAVDETAITEEHIEQFKNKFAHLEMQIAARGLGARVQVLSPKYSRPGPPRELDLPPLSAGVSYLQPVAGIAESLPFPNGSIDKTTSIHTVVHYSHLARGLMETARVTSDDGQAVFVTNGPGDKQEFRGFLREGSRALGKEPIDTVSSKLTYQELFGLLGFYFEEVEMFPKGGYQDTMEITEERLPDYLNAFNSYAFKFERPVVNEGRWGEMRRAVVEAQIGEEIAKNNVFLDTIDIAAIFARGPRRTRIGRTIGRLGTQLSWR